MAHGASADQPGHGLVAIVLPVLVVKASHNPPEVVLPRTSLHHMFERGSANELVNEILGRADVRREYVGERIRDGLTSREARRQET